jgi:hypothetical protein
VPLTTLPALPAVPLTTLPALPAVPLTTLPALTTTQQTPPPLPPRPRKPLTTPAFENHGAEITKLNLIIEQHIKEKKDLHSQLEYQVAANVNEKEQIYSGIKNLSYRISELSIEREQLNLKIKELNERLSKQSEKTQIRIKEIADAKNTITRLTKELESFTSGKLIKPTKGDCSICLDNAVLINVGCCIGKSCIKCFVRLTINYKYKCPFCRCETS